MAKKRFTSTAETVYVAIRERILSWEYTPGTRLVEQSLCKEFDVSRVPVREALSKLIDEHLVDKVPNVGCRVRELSLPDIDDMYELRIALELHCVDMLIETADSLSLLAPLKIEWIEFAGISRDAVIDPIYWSQKDEEFHYTIVSALGNRFLAQSHKEVNDQLRFLRMKDITDWDKLMNTCALHISILDAIIDGDTTAARRYLCENVLTGKANVKSALKDTFGH